MVVIHIKKGNNVQIDTRKALTFKNLFILKLKSKRFQNKGCLTTSFSLQILVHRILVCVEILNVTFEDYILLEKNNENNPVISEIKARN